MNNKISKFISTLFNENSLEINEAKWKMVSQTLYDHIKNEEKIFGIPSSKEVLPRLFINNMTAEQIWQQIEFQNELVISMRSEAMSDNPQNLCVNIAELCNKANDEANESALDDDADESALDDDADKSSLDDGDNDREIANSEVDDDENNDCEDNDIDKSSNASLSVGENDEENEDDIEENLTKLDEELNDDLDKDTFADIALENDDSEEEEEYHEEDIDNEDEGDQAKERKPVQSLRENFSSTSVDTKFFNLRQCEWIADNDVIGEDIGDDIDLMKDEDYEEEENEMYDDFFDPPSQNSEKISEENVSTVKSKFASKLDEESALKKGLEEETFIAEKPWLLKGEVQKTDRPENSTLQHHLEATVAVRMKPIITEEINKKIEELLLKRIKNQSFDDVERKIKPVVDPTRFKQKLILDQEKSNKSLTAIYEEEYLRKQQESEGKVETLHSVLSEADEKYEELPVHKEIKKDMEDIFMKLEALFNYHYTPKYKPPEVKIITNVKAITIEESTPAAVSDATLLAPQEIVAPIRGELKGETEKEKTDKRRERRSKKQHQKQRAKREEEKLQHQMKKRDKNGLMQAEASIKLVQKAIKKGQIKVLDRQQKGLKSSKQMQGNFEDRSKKRKAEENVFTTGSGKKQKGNKPLTMSKLLL